MTRECLRLAYFGLCLSSMIYGFFVWGSSSIGVFILQKRCVRLLTRRKYNERCKPFFRNLLHHNKFTNVFVILTIDSYNNIMTLGDSHVHGTRYRHLLKLRRCRLTSFHNSFHFMHIIFLTLFLHLQEIYASDNS